MKRKAAPAFQFYPDAWLSSTDISLMTPAEEGAYIRLICHAWMQPHGLPSDDAMLAVLSRLGRKQWATSKASILAKFELRDGRYFNGRIEMERVKQAEWKEKSSNGGKQSATKRQANRNQKATTLENNGQPKGNTPSPSLSSSPKTTSSSGTTSAVRAENHEGTELRPEPGADDPIETIQAWLEQYVGQFRLSWGKPTHGVCFKVFMAMNGASLDELEELLRDLYEKKQAPKTSYGWFISVIGEHFEGRANAARTVSIEAD